MKTSVWAFIVKNTHSPTSHIYTCSLLVFFFFFFFRVFGVSVDYEFLLGVSCDI